MPRSKRTRTDSRTPVTVNSDLVTQLEATREVLRATCGGKLSKTNEEAFRLETVLDTALKAYLDGIATELLKTVSRQAEA